MTVSVYLSVFVFVTSTMGGGYMTAGICLIVSKNSLKRGSALSECFSSCTHIGD